MKRKAAPKSELHITRLHLKIAELEKTNAELIHRLKTIDDVCACDNPKCRAEEHIEQILEILHPPVTLSNDQFVGFVGAAFAAFAFAAQGATMPRGNPKQQWWRTPLELTRVRDVTMEMIDIQFRRLSKIHHPDKGGNEEKFKELTAARDAARKELMDQWEPQYDPMYDTHRS